MANRLNRTTKLLAVRMLCEGSSIRSVNRITGTHHDTIGRLILSFGNASRNFLDEQPLGRGLGFRTLREVRADHQRVP